MSSWSELEWLELYDGGICFTNVMEAKIYYVISVEELVSVYIIMMFSMYLSIPLFCCTQCAYSLLHLL